MNTPVLKTKKLVLRAFETKDLALFAQYRAEQSVAQYQSWTHYTYQDAIELFQSMDYATFGSTGNWYQLAITLSETDELVGDLAIHFIDNEQLEIGFTVAPAYQGQHVAFQAVSRFLNYAFADLNIHRVIAITDSKNSASFRLLEKLGFRREAHFVQNIFFKGAWGDEYLYALLQSEYSFS